MSPEDCTAGETAPLRASSGIGIAGDGSRETLAQLLARAIAQIEAGEFAEAAATTECAVARFPGHPAPRRLPSRAAFARGEWAEAVRLAHEALADFPDDAALLKAGYRAALRTSVEDRHYFVERLVAIGHQPARYLPMLANLKIDRMEAEEALRLLDAAVAHGADPLALKTARARAASRAGDWALAETLWTEVKAATGARSGPARDRAQVSLARARRHRSVASESGDVPVADPAAPVAEPTLFRTVADDLTCLRVPGSRDVLLRFGALSTMMGIARPKISTRLRSLGINVIAIRDPRRALTMRGLPTLGDDLDTSVAGLRALLAGWGVENVYVVGSSAGGYPALRYGVALGARRILLLSAGLTPQGVQGAFADRMVAMLGDLFVEPRTLLENAAHAPEVIAAFSTASRGDRAHAEHLAGLPGVSLVEVPGDKRQMEADNALPLFDRLLSDSEARVAAQEGVSAAPAA